MSDGDYFVSETIDPPAQTHVDPDWTAIELALGELVGEADLEQDGDCSPQDFNLADEGELFVACCARAHWAACNRVGVGFRPRLV